MNVLTDAEAIEVLAALFRDLREEDDLPDHSAPDEFVAERAVERLGGLGYVIADDEGEPVRCDEPGCREGGSCGTPRIAGLVGGEYRWTCFEHQPKGWPEGRALSDGSIVPMFSGPDPTLANT